MGCGASKELQTQEEATPPDRLEELVAQLKTFLQHFYFPQDAENIPQQDCTAAAGHRMDTAPITIACEDHFKDFIRLFHEVLARVDHTPLDALAARLQVNSKGQTLDKIRATLQDKCLKRTRCIGTDMPLSFSFYANLYTMETCDFNGILSPDLKYEGAPPYRTTNRSMHVLSERQAHPIEADEHMENLRHWVKFAACLCCHKKRITDDSVLKSLKDLRLDYEFQQTIVSESVKSLQDGLAAWPSLRDLGPPDASHVEAPVLFYGLKNLSSDVMSQWRSMETGSPLFFTTLRSMSAHPKVALSFTDPSDLEGEGNVLVAVEGLQSALPIFSLSQFKDEVEFLVPPLQECVLVHAPVPGASLPGYPNLKQKFLFVRIKFIKSFVKDDVVEQLRQEMEYDDINIRLQCLLRPLSEVVDLCGPDDGCVLAAGARSLEDAVLEAENLNVSAWMKAHKTSTWQAQVKAAREVLTKVQHKLKEIGAVCPRGLARNDRHMLEPFTNKDAWWYCSDCGKMPEKVTPFWGCRACDYDRCARCMCNPRAELGKFVEPDLEEDEPEPEASIDQADLPDKLESLKKG